jgi:hypothetical protein
MSYQDKYLKYKNKYLELKNKIQKGGCSYHKTFPMDEMYNQDDSLGHFGTCNLCDLYTHTKLTKDDMRFLLNKPNELEIDETYIFAIAVSEPKNIYIHPESKKKKVYCEPTGTTMYKSTPLTHNCLVIDNEAVISAGTLTLTNQNTIEISNRSGHYKPSFESLDYVECLLNEKGFENIKKIPFIAPTFTPRPPLTLKLPPVFNLSEESQNNVGKTPSPLLL